MLVGGMWQRGRRPRRPATTSRSIRPSPGLGATAAAPGWWRCHWRRECPEDPGGSRPGVSAVGHHSHLERPLEQVELWPRCGRAAPSRGRSRPLPRRTSGERNRVLGNPRAADRIGQQPARTRKSGCADTPGSSPAPTATAARSPSRPPPHSEARRARARHRAWAAPRPPGRLLIARSSPRQCSSRPPVKTSAPPAPPMPTVPVIPLPSAGAEDHDRLRGLALGVSSNAGRRRRHSPSRAQAASAARSARERCHWPSTGVNRPAG